MVKDVKRLNIVIAIVCAHDNKLLDNFCKELVQTFEGHATYLRQHFNSMTPLRSIIKRTMQDKPELQLIVFANTNDKFGGQESFDELFDRAKSPFMNAGIIDLRGAEETGTGKVLRDAIKECLTCTTESIARDLIELIEKEN